jgi:hypothetical protein
MLTLAASARRRSPFRLTAFTLPSLLVVALAAHVARAQATSWLYLGGGAGVIEPSDQDARDRFPLVQIDTGLGSSATHPIVAGGILRVKGYVGGGLDLGALARMTSKGYARGDFGLGLDVGLNQRLWGVKTTELTGDIVLGAPWGLTAVAGAEIGAHDRKGFFVSLGFDFARLTVHRNVGLTWFANPMRSPED